MLVSRLLVTPKDIPTRKQGNLLYPLPPDYEELTSDGKRQARLEAVCRQDNPDAFEAAWVFFREYYLGDPEVGFYDQKVESPPMHYDMIRVLSTSKATLLACPRGFAKSTIVAEELPLMMLLTRPGSRIYIVKSTEGFIRESFDRLRMQLEENPYILEDFGRQRPPRGSGLWDFRRLRLNNRSFLSGTPIEGKARGGRAHWLILDDVEHDPSQSTDRRSLTRAFTSKMSRIYLPMRKRGCKITMICTLLERDTFSYHCMTTRDDPRFANPIWVRRVYVGEDKSGRSTWQAAYPDEFLAEQKTLMGPSAYAAEYMNNPGAAEDLLFQLGEGCQYTILGPDNEPVYRLDEPFSPELRVRYHRTLTNVLTDGEPVLEPAEEPLGPLLTSQARFITVDYAPTHTPESDFSAIGVYGYDRSDGALWLWDGWVGRASDPEIMRRIWTLARRWDVRFIAIEGVGLQMSFVNAVTRERQRLLDEGLVLPRVLPLKYSSRQAKEDRIGALEWRFAGGLMRLPVYRRYANRSIQEFCYQVEHFSKSMRSLPHDDALDTMAMAQEVLGARGTRGLVAPLEARQNLIDLYRAGQRYVPGTDIKILEAIPFEQLPPDVLQTAVAEHARDRQEEIQDRLAWQRMAGFGSAIIPPDGVFND
ncbi:MAG: hypothetical protein D6681_20290 [Calditrichaeota bacterium]|nr:MAG: hypothetical protein D6681_20290 [Calditrichota bacterium]